VFGASLDWRGLPTVNSAATALGLTALNLIVWGKTNAGMGSLYRSQHELRPLFKKADATGVGLVKATIVWRNGTQYDEIGAASTTPERATPSTRPSVFLCKLHG
jgi:hypothetical protein